MTAQLAMAFPIQMTPGDPAPRRPMPPLPADHPVAELAAAPWEGPNAWPGFEAYSHLVDRAQIDRCVAVFNAQAGDGGNRIRWDADIAEFVTESGDRFPRGTVEDVVRGLLRRA